MTFDFQVMMQTIPLAWSYLKVIQKYLSKDTSEIGLRNSNICIFQNGRQKLHKNRNFHICHVKIKIWRPNVHLKGQKKK